MCPSATLPMGRHPTVPLVTVTLSFSPLDGEGLPTTETTPEATLGDRRITKMQSASGGPCQRPRRRRTTF